MQDGQSTERAYESDSCGDCCSSLWLHHIQVRLVGGGGVTAVLNAIFLNVYKKTAFFSHVSYAKKVPEWRLGTLVK